MFYTLSEWIHSPNLCTLINQLEAIGKWSWMKIHQFIKVKLKEKDNPMPMGNWKLQINTRLSTAGNVGKNPCLSRKCIQTRQRQTRTVVLFLWGESAIHYVTSDTFCESISHFVSFGYVTLMWILLPNRPKRMHVNFHWREIQVLSIKSRWVFGFSSCFRTELSVALQRYPDKLTLNSMHSSLGYYKANTCI